MDSKWNLSDDHLRAIYSLNKDKWLKSDTFKRTEKTYENNNEVETFGQ